MWKHVISLTPLRVENSSILVFHSKIFSGLGTEGGKINMEGFSGHAAVDLFHTGIKSLIFFFQMPIMSWFAIWSMQSREYPPPGLCSGTYLRCFGDGLSDEASGQGGHPDTNGNENEICSITGVLFIV